jgi:hypothetical protein
MTEKEKLVKTKKTIKSYIYLGVFYLLVTLLSFIDVFFIEKDSSTSFIGYVGIFFYTIILLLLSIVIMNVVRYKSPMKIRKKAIRDYDERDRKIQQTANSTTLASIALILVLGIILSVSLDSLELLGFCFLSLLLMLIINFLSKIVLKKHH